MQVATFMVSGEPVAKERPRTVNGHTYTPDKTLAHETKIGHAFNVTRPKGWDMDGEFDVELAFFCAYNNKDIDNMIKTVLDGLNKVAWKDDRQVAVLKAKKRKVPRGGAGTTIFIKKITE